MKKLILLFTLMPTMIFGYPASTSWHNWVQDLRKQAIADGIRPALFDHAFRNLTPNPKLLRLDRSQPEKRLTYLKYRNTRASRYRIRMGRREFRRHRTMLNQAGRYFEISPCFITSIWGLESSYGRFVGNFNTIRSLATLAFDGRRSAFFRKQLILALHMVNSGAIALKNFKGEWAGASGQAQFLPSSWFKYAIDFDGDGRKDIWHTHADIFASIANYLHSNGWQINQPVKADVILPHNFDKTLITLKITKPISEWLKLGVKIKPRQPLPNKNVPASILRPYGGPSMMVFNNFKVLMSWNYSSYYAGTVTYMAHKICRP